MKHLLILIFTMFLVGCGSSKTVSVKRKFPDAPSSLKVTCPTLKEIDSTTSKLSDVISVVTENYGMYQECKIKVVSWNEWYNTQKDIFESVK